MSVRNRLDPAPQGPSGALRGPAAEVPVTETLGLDADEDLRADLGGVDDVGRVLGVQELGVLQKAQTASAHAPPPGGTVLPRRTAQ